MRDDQLRRQAAAADHIAATHCVLVAGGSSVALEGRLASTRGGSGWRF
jgi:hypothetical protein